MTADMIITWVSERWLGLILLGLVIWKILTNLVEDSDEDTEYTYGGVELNEEEEDLNKEERNCKSNDNDLKGRSKKNELVYRR